MVRNVSLNYLYYLRKIIENSSFSKRWINSHLKIKMIIL